MPRSITLQRWLVPLLLCLGLLSALMAIRWRAAAGPDALFEEEGKGKRNSGHVEASVVAATSADPPTAAQLGPTA